MEAETLLLIAVRLGYATEADTAPTVDTISEIGTLLSTLRARLLSAPPRSVP